MFACWSLPSTSPTHKSHLHVGKPASSTKTKQLNFFSMKRTQIHVDKEQWAILSVLVLHKKCFACRFLLYFLLQCPPNIFTYLTPSPLCSPITTCTAYLYLSKLRSGRDKTTAYINPFSVSFHLIFIPPFSFSLMASLISFVHSGAWAEVYCLSESVSVSTVWISSFATRGLNLERKVLRSTLEGEQGRSEAHFSLKFGRMV